MRKITIKALRTDVGLTQSDFAKSLGVCKETVSNWERGITTPDMAIVPNICDLLGVEMRDINFLPRTSLKVN